MNDNVFYFRDLNIIGGIETFFYQLGKKYGKGYEDIIEAIKAVGENF